MTAIELMTVGQLVGRFIELAIGQYEAELDDDNREYNRLFREIQAVRLELKNREGDQRRALLPLLAHSNAQVRLMAAITLLAIEPYAARHALQIISDRNEFPQAANARGMIRALEKGTYTPT